MDRSPTWLPLTIPMSSPCLGFGHEYLHVENTVYYVIISARLKKNRREDASNEDDGDDDNDYNIL